jgi:hypothetical protein
VDHPQTLSETGLEGQPHLSQPTIAGHQFLTVELSDGCFFKKLPQLLQMRGIALHLLSPQIG